ncbi:MAG: phosphatase PAP2 family protein [Ruminococcus sp.]|nr:phosphatase PAP2 family protein [Ruminococcus sp.]
MAEFITQFDFSILYWIQENIRTPFLDGVGAFLSYAFEAGIFWIVLALVLLVFRKTRTAGAAVLAAMLVALFVGELGFKNIICRERPCTLDPSVPLAIPAPSSYSCPSGHTGSSFAAAGGIFAFNKKLGVPALVLALIVGLSRMYLFVHFPTDVIFGIAVGLLSALTVYFIFKKFNVDRRLQGIGKKS